MRASGSDHSPAYTDSSPTLREYLDVLKRRWWSIVVIVVVAAAIAFIVTARKNATYTASAQVLVGRPDVATTLNGIPSLSDPDRVTATLAKLARVRPIAGRVLADTGLNDRTPDDFLAQSRVSQSQGVDVLEFSVTDKDESTASRLATAYAQEFIDYRRTLDAQSLRAALREVGRQLAALRAAGQSGSAAYAALLDNRRQLAALQTLSPMVGVVVQPATDASESRPNPMRAALLGGGLGLVIGIGLAFLAEALDTRVRSRAEVERRFGRPILAHLQLRSRQLQKTGALVTLRDPSSSEADAFRVLRASFEVANQDLNARSIVVTSAEDRDGKTVTAANLAVALARAGRRVILCDLDRSRSSLARVFSLEGKAGIAEVVLGDATLDEALASIDLDPSGSTTGRHAVMAASGNLQVLPLASSVSPTSGEFVGSTAVAEVLDELARRADIVLIDAPPLLGPSDAITLCDRVDAIVLVLRLDTLRRGTAVAVERALASAPAEILGIVVTGASDADVYQLEETTYVSRLPGSGSESRPVDPAVAPQPRLETTPSPRSGRRAAAGTGGDAGPRA